MTYKLLQCDESDAPEIARIWLSAFSEPFFHTLIPRDDLNESQEWATRDCLEAMSNDPGVRYLKITSDKHQDKFVSMAKWCVPVNGASYVDDLSGMVWPKNADAALCDAFFKGLIQKRKDLVGSRPHYFLEILATLPDHQGQGAASQLLRWGLDKADEEDVECYIEAAPNAEAIYARFGWEKVETFTIIGHPTTLMIRPPKSKRNKNTKTCKA